MYQQSLHTIFQRPDGDSNLMRLLCQCDSRYRNIFALAMLDCCCRRMNEPDFVGRKRRYSSLRKQNVRKNRVKRGKKKKKKKKNRPTRAFSKLEDRKNRGRGKEWGGQRG